MGVSPFRQSHVINMQTFELNQIIGVREEFFFINNVSKYCLTFQNMTEEQRFKLVFSRMNVLLEAGSP